MKIYKKGKLYDWLVKSASGERIKITPDANDLQIAKSFIDLLEERLSVNQFFVVTFVVGGSERIFQLNKHFLVAFKRSFSVSYRIMKNLNN